ncbi:MAG: PKD domain-containing protein [Bacteroidota bacterium]|nr:PKD domain-containing protein [Bacteroidota bacterium]
MGFYWEFGDGTTSTQRDPGTHIYPNYGRYDIILSVTGNNCTARQTETIVIGAITPIVDFEYDPERGCRPLRVNFTDKSKWTDVSTYLWDFGDGKGYSDAQNPTYTYNEAGVYSVSLTASNETGQVITEKKEYIIEVYDNPRAVFQVRPTTVYLPGKPVYTANTSINAVTYLWDFGDGTTSTEFEPTHIYKEVGVYDISLTVTNIDGCSNTFILRSAVKVEDGADLKVPNAFTPNHSGPSGSGGTGGVNDIFMPITEGVVEFNMIIFNRWGEMLFESRNINDGWDGYFKGKLCKQDVYVYKIFVKFIDGETATRIGDVTLLR